MSASPPSKMGHEASRVPTHHHELFDPPAEQAPDPRVPGRLTLTRHLPRSGSGPARAIQRQAHPATGAARPAAAGDAGLTEQWINVAIRPDLHAMPVQRKTAGAGDTAAEAPVAPAGGSGAALPDALRAQMERALGADFSAVRIHHGRQAEAMGALACTQGSDIHFAPGQYDPHSQRGQALLGHELAHVVQQAQGRVRATRQAKGAALNDDPALEREADLLGARAAQGAALDRPAAAPATAPTAARTDAAAPIQRAETVANVAAANANGLIGGVGELHALQQTLAGAPTVAAILGHLQRMGPGQRDLVRADAGMMTAILNGRSDDDTVRLVGMLGFPTVHAEIDALRTRISREALARVALLLRDGAVAAAIDASFAHSWSGWHELLPSGAAMTPRVRTELFAWARLATDATRIRKVMERRFAVTITRSWGVDDWTADALRAVWQQLDLLPAEHVTENTMLTAIRRVAARERTGGGVAVHGNTPTTSGVASGIEVGFRNQDVNETDDGRYTTEDQLLHGVPVVPSTVAHEIGHTIDLAQHFTDPGQPFRTQAALGAWTVHSDAQALLTTLLQHFADPGVGQHPRDPPRPGDRRAGPGRRPADRVRQRRPARCPPRLPHRPEPRARRPLLLPGEQHDVLDLLRRRDPRRPRPEQLRLRGRDGVLRGVLCALLLDAQPRHRDAGVEPGDLRLVHHPRRPRLQHAQGVTGAGPAAAAVIGTAAARSPPVAAIRLRRDPPAMGSPRHICYAADRRHVQRSPVPRPRAAVQQRPGRAMTPADPGLASLSAAMHAFAAQDFDRAAQHAAVAAERSPASRVFGEAARYLDRVRRDGKRDVYLAPEAFAVFIRGGGNRRLYERTSAALRAAHQEHAAAALLDIGTGDGLALVPALAEPIASVIASVTLIEPSAAMLATAAAGVEARGVRCEPLCATVQDLQRVAAGRRWDLAQATFSLQLRPARRSPRALGLAAPRRRSPADRRVRRAAVRRRAVARPRPPRRRALRARPRRVRRRRRPGRPGLPPAGLVRLLRSDRRAQHLRAADRRLDRRAPHRRLRRRHLAPARRLLVGDRRADRRPAGAARVIGAPRPAARPSLTQA